MAIHSVSPIRLPHPVEALRPSASNSGASFAGAMQDAMHTVSRLQSDAQQSAARLLAGENEDLHKVALDQQKAALAFDLFLQVRNKVVQAYQEVMRMQV